MLIKKNNIRKLIINHHICRESLKYYFNCKLLLFLDFKTFQYHLNVLSGLNFMGKVFLCFYSFVLKSLQNRTDVLNNNFSLLIGRQNSLSKNLIQSSACAIFFVRNSYLSFPLIKYF